MISTSTIQHLSSIVLSIIICILHNNGAHAFSSLHLFTQQQNNHAATLQHRYHNPKQQSKLFSTTNTLPQPQNSYYAAAGAPLINMDNYNIPLTTSINEWTAVLQAETSMQLEGIFLKAKNKEYFVDTLQYTIQREGGLGLLLTEIAGGREDGVGITMIEEVLEGGNADGCGIIPGDSIIALSVTNTNSKDGMNVNEERTAVNTECLGYDNTIEAITSLPPSTSSDDVITITVKRIRRQPKVNIKLQYPPGMGEEDVSIELFAGENLRRAMLTRGIKLNDKLVSTLLQF